MNKFLSLHWKTILISRIVMIGLLYSGPAYAEELNCSSLGNECEFYSCLEEKRNCGRLGYPTGFGKKYCLRFENKLEKFSDEGKIFIEKTRNCLIKTLLDAPVNRSCRNLKRQAFKDHIPCYLEGDFCELSKSDKKNLYKVVWPTLWRGKVISSGLKIKYICHKLKNQ